MGGTREERNRARAEFLKPDATTGKYKFDALVCSYEAVLKEKEMLGRILWKYLLIDEAHRARERARMVRSELESSSIIVFSKAHTSLVDYNILD